MSTLREAFPPAPTFTEKDLENLSGRVYLITGAASGVGFELAKLLYGKDATVYVIARSASRAEGAIESLKSAVPSSNGRLEPLVLDLADLATIKPAIQGFLEKERRVDVLFMNAGVMRPPAGSKSKNGYDLEIATHCLGPLLITQLLEERLRQTATAADTKPNGVRVVWVVSFMSVSVPKGGVSFDETGNPVQLKDMENYMQSKSGELLISSEFAKRWSKDGILSVTVNPGLMRTELQRNLPAYQQKMMGVMFKPPVYGAYSELYAGLSPALTAADNGNHFVPWGRKGDLPCHLKDAMAPQNGQISTAQKFFSWAEEQTRPFL